MHSYEEWTRREISRLRDEAQKASAEADTLQRAFDKWLELHGVNNEPPMRVKTVDKHNLNGGMRRGRSWLR
jgi:hypothetical protein